MTVAFKTTDATGHVGRRPKPVPEYATAAIAECLATGKNVQSEKPVTDRELQEIRADFRRAEKADPTIKATVYRHLDNGKVFALIEVKKTAKAASK